MIQTKPPTWTRGGWARDARTGEYRHPALGVVSRVLTRWLLEIPKAIRKSPEQATLTRRTRFEAMRAAAQLKERKTKAA